MQTQSNSRQRVKHDTIGKDGMKALFQRYETSDKENFRLYCKDVIEESTGRRETKDKFYQELDKAPSKDVMLQKVTNYLLAGQGLGV